MYCTINCEHLNMSKKKCEKFNKKLGYLRYKSKSLSYTTFEKCRDCENELLKHKKGTEIEVPKGVD